MKGFAKKSCNPVIGHLKDDADYSYAVHYTVGADEPYSCAYRSVGEVTAATLAELEAKIQKLQEFTLEWQDVLIVSITRRKTEGCPSESHTAVTFQMCHVAKNIKGAWVRSNWAPDSITRYENPCYNWPHELNLPAMIKDHCYGGEVTLILPYNEATVARIKAFQIDSVDKHQAMIDYLLENCKEAPKSFIDISMVDVETAAAAVLASN